MVRAKVKARDAVRRMVQELGVVDRLSGRTFYPRVQEHVTAIKRELL
jgi:hypothetical protein